MKTASSLSGRAGVLLRFGCGVATMAALTFSVLSAQAAQPQKGIRIGAEGAQRYSCTYDCQTQLSQCLASGTKSSICYYNYNVCLSKCTTTSSLEVEAELQ